MKATEARLLDLLKKSPQFAIPIYQRTYSWTERECRQLWEDILRAGQNDKVSAHFVGSIVYIQEGLYQATTLSSLLVIDGQQRLTTVSLVLAALAAALEKLPEDQREPVPGFSPKKLRNYYLLNPEEDGEQHYKLVLSQTDKDTLTAIVSGSPLPKDSSLRVAENYKLFQSLLAERGGDFEGVCSGLAKLMVVDVSLTRDQDNPQLIFESMNSTGKELSQADLIRNFILMGLDQKLQTQLYKDYWRPMEVDFGQRAYETHFDGFMRHYLTVKTGSIPRLGEVYEAFKSYSRSPEASTAGVEALVADIRAHAGYYCAMALGGEDDAKLKAAFHDLRELKVDVAYPFLLELYGDYAAQKLSRDDFMAAVSLVEAYVFRRAVCAIPTNSMNKTFEKFSRNLKKDKYLESIQAQFLLLPSHRRFPLDNEFRRELQTKDLYNFRSRSYCLRKMENHGRKERVPTEQYTVEHIIPQNEALSASWRDDLGEEWKRVQETWLHTLGNLTLTGYNSEYRDKPFTEKRDMPGGFKQSPLKLNEGLGLLERWDEAAIKKRAEKLAGTALDVWGAPKVDNATLAAYRPKAEIVSGYTIDTMEGGHHLTKSPIKELFEAFRKEVCAFDLSVVTEEFLKLYVAYKAETNFVDVVPQAKRLLLSLKIPLAEINDPQGMCIDAAGKGRWGNGDVEVHLSTLDELPYVLGLVRQSFEYQMGNGEE